MKTIIIAASIFYILGLKFSHNLDISIKTSPVDSISTPQIIKHQPSGSSATAVTPKQQSETGTTLKDSEVAEKEDPKTGVVD